MASSHISAIPNDRAWKQAYHAAIVEKDHQRLIHRIGVAREKLSERERQLMLTFSKAHQIPDNYALMMEELEAINDATYMLKALYDSLQHRDVAGEWSP